MDEWELYHTWHSTPCKKSAQFWLERKKFYYGCISENLVGQKILSEFFLKNP